MSIHSVSATAFCPQLACRFSFENILLENYSQYSFLLPKQDFVDYLIIVCNQFGIMSNFAR